MFDTQQPAQFYPTGVVGLQHRVWLRRKLRTGPLQPAVFVLHNPSVANHERNDPTATRGINFALSWGATDLIFVNVVTQVATKATALNPDSLNCPWSDWALLEAARLAREHNGWLVAAWGAPKGKAATCRLIANRMAEVRSMLGDDLKTLRVSPHGWPEHPLYLPSELTPKDWT